MARGTPPEFIKTAFLTIEKGMNENRQSATNKDSANALFAAARVHLEKSKAYLYAAMDFVDPTWPKG